MSDNRSVFFWGRGVEVGRGMREVFQKDIKKLLRVMDMLVILIVVMVLCMYTYVPKIIK